MIKKNIFLRIKYCFVFLKRIFSDLLDLLLPRTCCCCRRALLRWEEEVCNYCLMEMPLTAYENDPENLVAKVFWGRVYLEQATSWFFFLKESRYQKAVHQLKYQGRPGIGTALGKEFGYSLRRSRLFTVPDCIIPVPLHPAKMKKRGYNQSEMIAAGMSEVLGIPLFKGVLTKKQNTSTQTNKSRYDRFLNVMDSFSVDKPDAIRGLHVFLIDDVLTTGATIEACAACLLEVPGVKVSVATLAWAKE